MHVYNVTVYTHTHTQRYKIYFMLLVNSKSLKASLSKDRAE